VEGPRDRWVLLNSQHATRILRVVESALIAAGEKLPGIREMTN